MANKKFSKDVLEDVLTGEHDQHVPGLDELTQLIADQVKPTPEPPPKTDKTPIRQKKRVKKKPLTIFPKRFLRNWEKHATH